MRSNTEIHNELQKLISLSQLYGDEKFTSDFLVSLSAQMCLATVEWLLYGRLPVSKILETFQFTLNKVKDGNSPEIMADFLKNQLFKMFAEETDT